MSKRDIIIKIIGLCEDIKEMVVDSGTELMVIHKAQEIIRTIKEKDNGWEIIWEAPDGTFKGKCKNCGYIHYFIDGHEAQYKYCPQCGEQKRF